MTVMILPKHEQRAFVAVVWTPWNPGVYTFGP